MNDIKQIDWDLTVILNDWGNDQVDLFFNVVTHKFYAIPLYLVFLYFLYKKMGWRNLLIALVTIALVIAASDQLANLFKKTLILRLRPFREPALEGLISKVGKSGGRYGFYSGHASNAMAVAVYLWFQFKNHFKWLGIIALIWGILVVYSRVYLGVHYLGDVLMGGFMGSLLGYAGYHFVPYGKDEVHRES
ncbi:phosphatase PAP2 family protein [Nonlabens sp. SCSIO 43208]|uniref:phosphatase PAP2 family protein n=1 Tax=Nonlabens sp. SCSIO 43208 TaxID=2793009 RepID=UPI003D6C6E55